MTSFFSRIKFPKVIPESRSTPKNFSFAAFLPNPAPPVINFKFEKITGFKISTKEKTN